MHGSYLQFVIRTFRFLYFCIKVHAFTSPQVVPKVQYLNAHDTSIFCTFCWCVICYNVKATFENKTYTCIQVLYAQIVVTKADVIMK